jgi:hypothetical protein
MSDLIVKPDGTASGVMTFPLPADHWLFRQTEEYEYPPMKMRTGTKDPDREKLKEIITEAGRYAVRAATMNGKEDDFDPDALVRNIVIGMLGYETDDGLCRLDDWANPPEFRKRK